jgi:hypothetical protein
LSSRHVLPALAGRVEELQKHNAELLKLLEQKPGKSEASSKVGEFPRIRTNE